MEQYRTFCTFRVSSLLLGVEVKRVQEVIRQQKMTRVPGTGAAVCGLMNLRGRLVTALDLRHCLGLPCEGESPPLLNVVVRTRDELVSFMVHGIGDVRVVDGSLFEEPPETLAESARRLIRGVYKLNSGLLMILDTDAVLAATEPVPV